MEPTVVPVLRSMIQTLSLAPSATNKYFCCGIGREGDVEDGSARTVLVASGSAAFWTAGGRRSVNPNLRHELPLLCENLNAIVATITDVNQSASRNLKAVQDDEVVDIGWRTGGVIRWQRLIPDSVQWSSLATPPALESTGIHVEDKDPFVYELGIRDI